MAKKIHELASKRELYGVRDELKKEINALRIEVIEKLAAFGRRSTLEATIQTITIIGAMIAIIWTSLKK